MKKKVAIIDHLGAHGSSHHFYLFGQAKGLIENNVNVNLYTNSSTIDPKINGLGFFQFYNNIFSIHKDKQGKKGKIEIDEWDNFGKL